MTRSANLKAKLYADEASAAVGSGAAAKKRQRTWPVNAAAGGIGPGHGHIGRGRYRLQRPAERDSRAGHHRREPSADHIDYTAIVFSSPASFTITWRRPLISSRAVGGRGLGDLKVLQTGSVDLKKLASAAVISNGAGAFGKITPNALVAQKTVLEWPHSI